jgi:hypothetical protein
MPAKTALSFGAAVSLLLLGCSPSDPVATAAKADPNFRPTATIQDIMDAEVDPAADFLWGSVALISTAAGTQDRRPRTDKEWETVRNNAIILVEATNLLAMPGRVVATEGSRLDPSEVAGIEDPKNIQKSIEANWTAFVGFAHGLHDAAMEMLKAIDAKDVARLDGAGERLDQACEQCHRTFWYPNAVEPIQTLTPPKP